MTFKELDIGDTFIWSDDNGSIRVSRKCTDNYAIQTVFMVDGSLSEYHGYESNPEIMNWDIIVYKVVV